MQELVDLLFERHQAFNLLLMTDPLCLIDQLFLHLLADLITERDLGEVEFDQIAKDAGLNSESSFAEELIGFIVLIVEHLHLFSKWLLLQRLHTLFVLLFVRNGGEEFFNDFLLLFFLAGCGLRFVLVGLFLCDVVVLDQLEVIEADHEENTMDLVLPFDDLWPFFFGPQDVGLGVYNFLRLVVLVDPYKVDLEQFYRNKDADLT